MSWFLSVAILVALLPGLYIYTASVVQARFPTLRGKRICLLIAHPDDEAMFFAPTLQALTRPDTGNHVKILCLSTGNADGLGETRKKELIKSSIMLGVKENDIGIIDSPEFPDSMTTAWDETKISALLVKGFAPHLVKQKAGDSTAPSAAIDTIITFDARGVSSHPNHISLYRGARHFVAALMRGRSGWQSPVDVYTLTTVPLLRKYTSFADIFATMAIQFSISKRDRQRPASLLFLSPLVGSGGYPTAWSAMTTAHQSQMVWFRYGWIAFSRYMVLNDLRLEKIRAA